MKIPYYTVDVFTQQVFGGAQVAVIPESMVTDAALMQKVADELHAPSTVFIQSIAENRFALRFFTPQQETLFGAHTIVAAAHVLSSVGKIKFSGKHTPLQFECGNETVQAHVTHQDGNPVLTQLALTTEPSVDNFVPSVDELSEILGLAPAAIIDKQFKSLLVSSNGVYVIVPVRRLDALNAAMFNRKAWDRSGAPSSSAQQVLLFSTQTGGSGADFHLRLVGPSIGVDQDPPVGAAIPAFAAYLSSHEHIKKGTYSFIVERGSRETRQSLLHVELDNRPGAALTLRVGGSAVSVCQGVAHI
jgi:trans-2,3-dihydro-3-hydroxyanthranilate isomerase